MIISNIFKDLIPPLSSDEYQALEANILRDGIRDPLVVWGETLIDGHNRYEIAKKHLLDFNTVEYQFANEDEAKVWIIKNQFGRRNLSPAVRIELALLLEPLIQAQAKENSYANLKQNTEVQISSPRSDSGKSREQVAKLAGVSHDTVKKYKQIKEEASPELLEQVMKGTKKINTAFREIQTGTKTCSVCNEEKPSSDFPAGRASRCLKCDNAKRRPNAAFKEEVERIERWLHRETPTTNRIKALEVVGGFEFQVDTYTARLVDALEKVKKAEERQEVIDRFMKQVEVVNNFAKGLSK